MKKRVAIEEISGAYVLHPEMHADGRGYFAVLDVPIYQGPSRWCTARSSKGVIRGLHVKPGKGEAKIVRCSAGAVYDVIVDMRKDSPTYLRWTSFYLHSQDQLAIYIPAGCAHGYQALADDTDMTYRIDAAYTPDAELAIAWNDPELNIPWPKLPSLMSERDRTAPSLAEVEKLLCPE